MSFLNTKQVKISSVVIDDNSPFFQTKSLNGKYQKRMAGPQFFTLEFMANWMNQDTQEVKRFVAEYKFNKPFEFPLSYFSEFSGVVTGVPIASNKINKGSRLIPLTGFAGRIPAGTVIQFKNHSKLYTVTEEIAGAGTMKIFPALYQDVQQGEALGYKNLKGKFVLTNDKFSFSITSISNFKFTAMEYIL